MDGDGPWIHRAMVVVVGSLIVLHDGSYKQRVAKDVFSGAVVIRCRWTNKKTSCPWTERTDRQTETNYRWKILGAMVSQLIPRTAWEGHSVPRRSRVWCGCDNIGMVCHGQEFWAPLQES